MIHTLDLETLLIRDGLKAPPPVCMAYRGRVYTTDEITPAITPLLEGSELINGHNIVYDMLCLFAWHKPLRPLILSKFDRLQIVDTMVFERLAQIAKGVEGPLGLGAVCKLYDIPVPDKSDEAVHKVRTSFGRLYKKPLSAYSKEQLDYVLSDADNPEKLISRQMQQHKCVKLKSVAEITRRNYWLDGTSNYGLKTDPKMVDRLKLLCKEHLEELREDAEKQGFIRPEGSKNENLLRAAVTSAYKGRPPMTKPDPNRKSKKPFVPRAKINRDTLAESGDPSLESFAEYGEWASVQNKDLPLLIQGVKTPISTRFGLARTMRSTSSSPNIQNIGKKKGVRQCFIPRPGNCFIAADHSGLELSTLAQVCVTKLGLWRMANKINEGIDLHCDLASHILNIPYEEGVKLKESFDKGFKKTRDGAKVVNFGGPGALSAPTLVIYAKGNFGLRLTLQESENLIKYWKQENPDAVEFLASIRKLPKDGPRTYVVKVPGSEIIRGRTPYCAAANIHFQGLGAMVESRVGWDIHKACYGGSGPLKNCRPVNFVHDEFILECPIGQQTEGVAELCAIMKDSARVYLPDVKVEAEGVAMARWSKNAQPKYKDGELLIWDEKMEA